MADIKLDKPWYMATTLETSAAFDVRVKQGLDSEQVKLRSKPSKKKSKTQRQKTPTLPPIFWILQLIAVSLSVSVFLLDGIAIALAFCLTAILLVFFGLAQQGYVRHGFLVIAKQPPALVTVRRGGDEYQVAPADVVPGDCIVLQQGDYVPADVRLTEVKQLLLNQSEITGEILPAIKNTFTLHKKQALVGQKNMAFAGSFVHEGSGVGIVVSSPVSLRATNGMHKHKLTNAQEKKRLVAAAIALAVGCTALFFGLNMYAVVALSALLALSAYYYVTFWLQYVAWVSLYEQCLDGGVRFRSFTALQEIAKTDYILLRTKDTPSDLAAFVHRMQAELRVEVRPLVPKSDIKAYERELNITGSALTEAEFMGSTRDKKMKQLREYQFLVGFEDVAIAESISLLTQAGHTVLWVDDAVQLQNQVKLANSFVSHRSGELSAELIQASAATYNKAPNLKKLSQVFEAIGVFNRITKH